MPGQNQDHQARSHECLRVGNWAEARYEWKWGSDEDADDPLDEIDWALDRLPGMLAEGKLESALEVLENAENRFKGYRRQDTVRARRTVKRPAELLEELHQREDDEDYRACMKILPALQQGGRWRIRDASARARRYELLYKLKAVEEQLQTGREPDKAMWETFAALGTEEVCRDPRLKESFIKLAERYALLCISNHDVSPAKHVAGVLQTALAEDDPIGMAVLERLRAECLKAEIVQACEKACRLIRVGQTGEAMDHIGDLMCQVEPEDLNRFWEDSELFLAELTELNNRIVGAEELALQYDFSGALDVLLTRDRIGIDGEAETVKLHDPAEILRQSCQRECRERRESQVDEPEICPGCATDKSGDDHLRMQMSVLRAREIKRISCVEHLESLAGRLRAHRIKKRFLRALAVAKELRKVSQELPQKCFSRREIAEEVATAQELVKRLRSRCWIGILTLELPFRFLLHFTFGRRPKK